MKPIQDVNLEGHPSESVGKVTQSMLKEVNQGRAGQIFSWELNDELSNAFLKSM